MEGACGSHSSAPTESQPSPAPRRKPGRETRRQRTRCVWSSQSRCSAHCAHGPSQGLPADGFSTCAFSPTGCFRTSSPAQPPLDRQPGHQAQSGQRDAPKVPQKQQYTSTCVHARAWSALPAPSSALLPGGSSPPPPPNLQPTAEEATKNCHH